MDIQHRNFKDIPTELLKEYLYKAKQELAYRRDKLKEKQADCRVAYVQKIVIPKDVSKEKRATIIRRYNSNNLLSLKHINSPLNNRKKYLEALLRQNWSSIYADDSIPSEENFYVYAHVDPSKQPLVVNNQCGGNYGGLPFYIGKGSGYRAFNLSRNQAHGIKIRTLLKEQFSKDSLVTVLFKNLSEVKAFEIEAKLIYFFGTIYEEDRAKTFLLNIDIPRIPIYNKGVMIDMKSKCN